MTPTVEDRKLIEQVEALLKKRFPTYQIYAVRGEEHPVIVTAAKGDWREMFQGHRDYISRHFADLKTICAQCGRRCAEPYSTE